MSGATEDVEISGLEEIIENLNRLKDLPEDDLKTVAIAGAQPLIDGANRAAPGPHIVYKVKITSTGVEVKIGPDKAHWHYRFFEYGATAHEISGKPLLIFEGREALVITHMVKNAGGVVAKPFMRNTLDSQAAAVMPALASAARNIIPGLSNG